MWQWILLVMWQQTLAMWQWRLLVMWQQTLASDVAVDAAVVVIVRLMVMWPRMALVALATRPVALAMLNGIA